MIYVGVAIALGLIAAGIALLALRLLLGRHWLLGFVRGAFGLTLVALAVILALAAWDLRGYQQLVAEQPLGTLAFSELGNQRFAVTLVDPKGNEQRFELDGDMWQLDVRVLKWNNALARLGFKPGYRLDRISGRYVALEDEQLRRRSVISLRSDEPALDVWKWLHRIDRQFSLIDAAYGSATYLPMADGAMFSVTMGNSGLVARPLNDRASQAVDTWE